jgi:hypothetical protein
MKDHYSIVYITPYPILPDGHSPSDIIEEIKAIEK